MGLLDELEQEAERQRQEDARLAAEREGREKVWQQSLEPAMRRLDEYMRRVTQNLTFLKRRMRVVYDLPGYGDVVAYVEPSFIVRSDPGKHSYEIVLEMLAPLSTDECPVVVADSPTRVRSLRNLLQQHRLGGTFDERKNANNDIIAAKFQAKGRIAMSLNITADIDGGVARFNLVNLEGFGQSTRSFTPEQLTDELFDSLGRFIAREEMHFAQEVVGDDVRRQLQSKLQRDQIRREWEQKLSRQLQDDEARVVDSLDPANRPGGLIGRIKLFTKKLIGGS